MFASPSQSGNAWRAVLGVAPFAALNDVASAFMELQEARHEADYDLARSFTGGEVEALVARTKAAFTSWASVAGSFEAEVFLVALLAKGRT